jgi:hypothetical protein
MSVINGARLNSFALNQPLLWSYVDFATLTLSGAAEILARAKSILLHLGAIISSHRWDNFRSNTSRKELQARVPFIRHLRTSSETVRLLSTLEELGSPAPTLEYIPLSSHST